MAEERLGRDGSRLKIGTGVVLAVALGGVLFGWLEVVLSSDQPPPPVDQADQLDAFAVAACETQRKAKDDPGGTLTALVKGAVSMGFEVEETVAAMARRCRVATERGGQAMGPREVIYTVEGDGPVSLTLTNEHGGIEQSTVELPYRRVLHLAKGDHVHLAAQNEGRGQITCRIEVEGKMVSTSTSEGEFHIAVCDGMVP
jgi:hypothetical protein